MSLNCNCIGNGTGQHGPGCAVGAILEMTQSLTRAGEALVIVVEKASRDIVAAWPARPRVVHDHYWNQERPVSPFSVDPELGLTEDTARPGDEPERTGIPTDGIPEDMSWLGEDD